MTVGRLLALAVRLARECRLRPPDVTTTWLRDQCRREWGKGIDQARVASWPIPKQPKRQER